RTPTLKDPYAVYSACGAIFPDGDGDGYESLCLKAKPDNATEIRQLFAENSSPPFALIDNVGGGLSWPTLRTCLQAESAREILLALLAPSEQQADALNASEGWAPEAKALLFKALGLKLMTKGKTLSSIADEMWRYLLFSEFAFDLPSGLPPALSNVPRAPAEAKILVEDLCDTLRGNISSRSEYIARAECVESELDLPKVCYDIIDLGKRDTFPFEERTFLVETAKAICAEEMDRAKQIIGRHGASVWIGKGENQAQWGLVDAGLRLSVACDDAERQLIENARSLEALVSHYATALQDVDRLQREFEQAVGDYIPDDNALTGAVQHARKRYAKLAEKVQMIFVKHLEATGWPVQG
ncbi:hypothetical protein, partial [Bosea sp. TAB14]|uniref:hypothetical protein n=1 Tax=Bosea sp. TAB14 TaxID=3237481 RepID=UPI003F8F4CCA